MLPLIASATLSGFLVLVLDLSPGPRLKAGKSNPDHILAQLKHSGLLLAISVRVAERQEVPAFLREDEDGIDHESDAHPASRLLSVLQRIDLFVRNLKALLAGLKYKHLLIFC